ncbi:MAG: ABC transporter permease [Desulfobulbus propionicus]|nr:MAG: ABC transporter permease [Desulfobulbus propionicus]
MLTGVPHYILPGPLRVMQAITGNWTFLLQHLMITLAEIMAGLFLGILLGTATALIMYVSPLLKRWMLPVLVISQAIPVFALAPLLVLWLGYGMASKIAMAILIIYFPVTSSLFNGMNKTQPELLELARVMDATTLSSLRYIVLPSALPGFAAGARVAAAVAPIGAVIGEWVGSSSGLGYYMLHANARMQVDVMFAALAMLVVLALGIYYFVDWALEKLIYW